MNTNNKETKIPRDLFHSRFSREELGNILWELARRKNPDVDPTQLWQEIDALELAGRAALCRAIEQLDPKVDSPAV